MSTFTDLQKLAIQMRPELGLPHLSDFTSFDEDRFKYWLHHEAPSDVQFAAAQKLVDSGQRNYMHDFVEWYIPENPQQPGQYEEQEQLYGYESVEDPELQEVPEQPPENAQDLQNVAHEALGLPPVEETPPPPTPPPPTPDPHAEFGGDTMKAAEAQYFEDNPDQMPFAPDWVKERAGYVEPQPLIPELPTEIPVKNLPNDRNWGGQPEANQAIAALTGYQGDFGGQGFTDFASQMDPDTLSQVIDIYRNIGGFEPQNLMALREQMGSPGPATAPNLDSGELVTPAASPRNWGAYPDLNQRLAALTGYGGDFGAGGFTDYIAGQPDWMKRAADQLTQGLGGWDPLYWDEPAAPPTAPPSAAPPPAAPERNWGAYPELNQRLAALTGYGGDFGAGGFTTHLREQPDWMKQAADKLTQEIGGWDPFYWEEPAAPPPETPTPTQPSGFESLFSPETLGGFQELLANLGLYEAPQAAAPEPPPPEEASDRDWGANPDINRQIAELTGYTGDFGNAGFTDYAQTLDPDLLRQAIGMYQKQGGFNPTNLADLLPGGQYFGANPDVNRQIAELTGYTGDFGLGQFTDFAETLDPDTLRQVIGMYQKQGGFNPTNLANMLPGGQYFGDNPDVNRQIAELTGYTGDFGLEQFTDYAQGLDRNTLNQVIDLYKEQGGFDPTNLEALSANFYGNNPELNKQIAELTGYTGSFGTGGFTDYAKTLSPTDMQSAIDIYATQGGFTPANLLATQAERFGTGGEPVGIGQFGPTGTPRPFIPTGLMGGLPSIPEYSDPRLAGQAIGVPAAQSMGNYRGNYSLAQDMAPYRRFITPYQPPTVPFYPSLSDAGRFTPSPESGPSSTTPPPNSTHSFPGPFKDAGERNKWLLEHGQPLGVPIP